MKANLAIAVILTLFAFTSDAYSSCHQDNDWSEQYGYGYTKSYDCACTDPGWKYNDCVSKDKLCAAFGNMGAR